MKNLTFIFAIVICFAVQAQVPEAFKFQAVIHGSGGTLLSNQDISVRISILQSTVTGSAVYTETHSATTNANGVVNLEIGNGADKTGSFNDIAWSADKYFVKTEIDPTGGTNYEEIGISQLLSVPYALQSKNAAHADRPWQQNGSNIFYDSGTVIIGSSTQESTSGLFINVPDTAQSNGLFIKSHDINSKGIPFWLRMNTDDYVFGTGAGMTQGRFFRMEDQRFGHPIWDMGIGEFSNFFITNAGFGIKPLTISNQGYVGIGNENPQYKLHVGGTVNAAGYLVNGIPLTFTSPWIKNGNDLSYTTGHVNIGTTSQETVSGLYVTIPTPTSEETRSNGIFVHANDVLSRGFPLWIHSNTAGLNYGFSEGQTQGRMLRLEDARYGYDAIWDFGIDQHKSMFIMGGDFSRKMTITTDGKIGVGTETPHAKLEVSGGDVYINNNTSGLSGVIMKSPSGSCFRLTVSDTGAPVFTSVPCPN